MTPTTAPPLEPGSLALVVLAGDLKSGQAVRVEARSGPYCRVRPAVGAGDSYALPAVALVPLRGSRPTTEPPENPIETTNIRVPTHPPGA